MDAGAVRRVGTPHLLRGHEATSAGEGNDPGRATFPALPAPTRMTPSFCSSRRPARWTCLAGASGSISRASLVTTASRAGRTTTSSTSAGSGSSTGRREASSRSRPRARTRGARPRSGSRAGSATASTGSSAPAHSGRRRGSSEPFAAEVVCTTYTLSRIPVASSSTNGPLAPLSQEAATPVPDHQRPHLLVGEYFSFASRLTRLERMAEAMAQHADAGPQVVAR